MLSIRAPSSSSSSSSSASASRTAACYSAVLGAGVYGVAKLALKWYRWRTSPLRRAPGPPVRSFFLGYFRTILKNPFMSQHVIWWKDLQTKYGSTSVPLMAYSSMLGIWSVVVLDPDLVKTILADPSAARDPVRFPKKYLFAKEIIGDGLVTLEGSAWARHRRIIQPSFQIKMLKESLDRSVSQHSATLIAAWRKAQGSTIDLFAHLSALTLDVIGEVAFSHEFGTSKSLLDWAEKASAASKGEESELPAVSDPLQKAMQASFRSQGGSIILAILGFSWLDKYVNRKAHRTHVLLNAAVDDIIQEALEKAQKGHGLKEKSLLQLLFDAKDAESPSGTATTNGTHRKTLSDQELRDETKTFIMAGHETTATWCYWALFALAKYPDIQQKVFHDISQHVNNDPATALTLEDVDQMSYFWAFMLEVLRVYSPVGMVIRFTSQEENFKGYTVPANTRLVIPLFLLQRHPDHWTHPDEFLPERWLNEKEMANRHAYCFLPFSTGLRNCIGQRFAEMEAKLIVANIARVFTVQFAPCFDESEMTLTNFLTMKAKPAIKVCVKER